LDAGPGFTFTWCLCAHHIMLQFCTAGRAYQRGHERCAGTGDADIWQLVEVCRYEGVVRAGGVQQVHQREVGGGQVPDAVLAGTCTLRRVRHGHLSHCHSMQAWQRQAMSSKWCNDCMPGPLAAQRLVSSGPCCIHTMALIRPLLGQCRLLV
jgi:hypothetical protein